jgi:RNA polymerase sigma factor (sigma-70 family)
MVNGLAVMDDWQLLNEYATRNSEEAFRTLVERHAGMVYHTALRQARDPDAAEEVTQAVFIALAQKAGRIPRQTLLYGWLFRATRFAVMNWIRDETCRRRYEQEAMNMEISLQFNEAESVWEQISPHLNDALERLSHTDRDVVMSRFFGNKSHKEVARTLGISEDTAKKRLSRALEKLRIFFARRGAAVPAVALLAAFSACGAQAAPSGLASAVTAAALAKSGAGAASTLTLAKATLKLIAWAKAKTALAVGAGALLVAAGTVTTVFQSGGQQLDDTIGNLERQSGKRIVWDKRINLSSADLDLKNLSFEQALDQIAVKAGAYWTIDYAVYGSDPGLQQLLGILRDGSELQSGGWTNLSSRKLHPSISMTGSDPHGRTRAFMRMREGVATDDVGMIVVLSPEAAAKMAPDKGAIVQAGDTGAPGPRRFGGAFEVIGQAMKEGVADGVLAPERLLAETRLVSGTQLVTPMPANSDAAARLAKQTHAHWTTIYTLRKSPLEGAGIKLAHTGMEKMYPPPGPPPGALSGDPTSMVGQMQSQRFTLTPEDRAAHQRAVEALKQKRSNPTSQ